MEQTTAFEKAKKKKWVDWQESRCVVQSEQRVRRANAPVSLLDRILSSENLVTEKFSVSFLKCRGFLFSLLFLHAAIQYNRLNKLCTP